MMVFIMSRRENNEKRKEIREMWSDVGSWGVMTARFAICQHPSDDEDSEIRHQLDKEAQQHEDLTYLDCDEGYLEGRLTRKVLEAMKNFVSSDKWVKKHDLFMKTDDDTFVSPSRLCDFLHTHRVAHANRFSHSYIGVFAEAGERVHGKRPPCRDPSSPWYEPYEKFQGELYPLAAKGGPGYILSTVMVKKLVSHGIAEANILNNEDRAVGVWVDELKNHGMSIQSINVPGTDGYEDYHPGLISKSGLWSNYPYAIHHHLAGSEIKCLHRVGKSGKNNEHVDKCFEADETTTISTPPNNFFRMPLNSNFDEDVYVLACLGHNSR